uniref:Uncharacterized protein n=1 Tax=Anopheles culicifacies TaxID=139723 RepID=A0A182MQE9_9DIPT
MTKIVGAKRMKNVSVLTPTGGRTSEDGSLIRIPQEQLEVLGRGPIARRSVVLLELVERFFYWFRHDCFSTTHRSRDRSRETAKTLQQVARTIKNRLKTSRCTIVSEVSWPVRVRGVRE